MPEFKVIPNYETLRDYVLPHLAPKNMDDVSKLISDLQSCNVSVGATAAALVGFLLSKDDIKFAAEVGKYLYLYFYVRSYDFHILLFNCLIIFHLIVTFFHSY